MNNLPLFRWFRNVSIAKKLYFTVGIMAVLIGVELVVLFFCLSTLSAVRAYVAGEGLWSKAQKDAIFHLYKYGASRNEEDYVLFHEFMKVPIGDSKTREELQKEQPDMARARQGFLEGRNHPDDVDGMIDLFINFAQVSYISKAIHIWGEAEPILMKLIPIAENLRKEINSEFPSHEKINQSLLEIASINQQLTTLEDEFSYTLGEGSRWLEGIVRTLLFSVALTVEITGLVLAISVSRGIQKGLNEIMVAATAFAKGVYDARATVLSRDEIGTLATLFNTMCADLQKCIVNLGSAQQKFRLLIESAPDAMVIADSSGKIKLVNAQAETMFGYNRKDLLEGPIELLIPRNLKEEIREYSSVSLGMVSSSARHGSEFRGITKDGRQFAAEVRISQIVTGEGPLVAAVVRDISDHKRAVAQRIEAEEALQRACDELQARVSELGEANEQLRHEISERQRAEEELRRAFAMLEQHVNNTPLGVIEWELDRAAGEPPRVQRWSARAQAILGWTESEVVGRSANEIGFVYEGDAARATDTWRDLVTGRCPNNSVSLRCYTKERQVRHCQWYNSALRSKSNSGRITILSLIEDVTERVAALEDVYRLAHHDTLTGLPNRIMLHDRLGQALAGARRHGQRVAVMMLDLDHFKNVNDALGHSVGDALLQGVASRLGSQLRASDTLARVGGDEFVLIQPDLAGPSGATIMARKLVEALTEPLLVQGYRLHIGTSVGITLFPDDGTDPDLLLRNADIALYRAKHDGRGQYRFYSRDMDVELKATRSVEDGLRHALEHDRLKLLYQPIFALADGRVQGVEALIRWRHLGGGVVPPASFIPVAEMSGLIIPLGEWILREACRQARAWVKADQNFRVAVNLSAVQLRQPDFAALIERALEESGLPSSALELEVTESVFLDPSKFVITRTLHEVAEMGVNLAIDDFGTGYSSLGYLKHFPFDRIKIDKSFVRDIGAGADTDADAIVKAIIALGRSLGRSVTAEGVETEHQLTFLRRNTCAEAQGYLLARPGSADEIEQLFSSVPWLPIASGRSASPS
jgi:diguanylate cyclase (GGDEF)-like protein/PAS domain S-box-containing protein